jgi:hypothetical protein
MIVEYSILISTIPISAFLLYKFVPRSKIRDAWFIFLFLQTLTWIPGLLVVEKGWIEYPTQLLPNENNTNQSSFLFEFFIFPVVAIIFSLKYPSNARRLHKFFYYLIIIGFCTFLEVLVERYTDLVEYISWKWYWTFISVWLFLFINHTYYTWFKKDLMDVNSNV